MKHYNVVAAVINYQGKYLCMQRNSSKYDYTSFKFEFPGGKIEEGETRPQALMRELHEEMDFDVSITEDDYLLTVEHKYPDFSITMHAFLCGVKSPEFIMKEHISFQWLSVEEMPSLDWAAADIPIVEFLQKMNK